MSRGSLLADVHKDVRPLVKRAVDNGALLRDRRTHFEVVDSFGNVVIPVPKRRARNSQAGLTRQIIEAALDQAGFLEVKKPAPKVVLVGTAVEPEPTSPAEQEPVVSKVPAIRTVRPLAVASRPVRVEILRYIDVNNPTQLDEFASRAFAVAKGGPKRSNGTVGWKDLESAMRSVVQFLGGGNAYDWCRAAFSTALAEGIKQGTFTERQSAAAEIVDLTDPAAQAQIAELVARNERLQSELEAARASSSKVDAMTLAGVIAEIDSSLTTIQVLKLAQGISDLLA